MQSPEKLMCGGKQFRDRKSMLMIQAKMYHKPFFKKKPEYSPEQKRYLDYYDDQVKRGGIRFIIYTIIPTLLLIVFLSIITNSQFSSIFGISYCIFVATCQILGIISVYKDSKKFFPLVICKGKSNERTHSSHTLS